jgi:hypothetical protein
VDVDEAGVRRVTVPPHLLEQDLTREHLPGLAGQRHEEVELQRGERDRLARTRHLVTGHVDRDIRHLQHLRGRRLEHAQARPDAGDELFGLERLGDVVVRPRLQTGDDVHRVRLGGEHDDGGAGLRADLAAHLQPVLAGEHEIEQDEVRSDRAERLEGAVAGRAELGLEALALEDDSDHLRQRRIVIDHQDACIHDAHCSKPPGRRCGGLAPERPQSVRQCPHRPSASRRRTRGRMDG